MEGSGFTPDPATHTTYEYTATGEVRPGDVVVLESGGSDGPVLVTHVRAEVRSGRVATVSLYRKPTDAEYEMHARETDEDLLATWLCTSVAWYPILKAVPDQGHGNLSY